VSLAELLDDLAHAIPDLPEAACRGHADLFDVARTDRAAVAKAKAICASCPALDDCRAWLADQPAALRPCGVVAGRYVAPPPGGRQLLSLRFCAECGRGFMAKRWDARLCSAVCRMRASLKARAAGRTCVRCGGVFTAKRVDAQYCSARCRVASHRRERRYRARSAT
jgi:hypothetical protein